MASAMTSTLISEAASVQKILHGIICVYKPAGWGLLRVSKELKNKICSELNSMEPPPRLERVELRRVNDATPDPPRVPLENEQVVATIPDGNSRIEIVKGLSYSDHPLITGPRYMRQDIKLVGTGKTAHVASGVYVFGLNNGNKTAQKIYHSRWMRTYLVSGRFGIATDTNFISGNVVEKATYGGIKQYPFERFLASTQASHQRMAFVATGTPLHSERAYELASQGLIRPSGPSTTVIYSIKLTDFKLPDFTLEIKSINEDTSYFMTLIHQLGLRLHSVACCTKIQCTQVGPFGLNDALLFKHWTLENLIENMNNSKETLSKFNLNGRQPWVEAF